MNSDEQGSGRFRSDRSDRSDSRPVDRPWRLRAGGGYRSLKSFQVATVIYDGTVDFCRRFVDPASRLVDQMVQAARSGRQNIAEGSRAATASSQTELRLVGVARASLDELLLDYEDYLRQHRLPAWTKDHPQAREVRELAREGWVPPACLPNESDRTDRTDPSDRSHGESAVALYGPYTPWLTHEDPGVVANTLVCLIHQANYLLDNQVAALERDFVGEGGYSEQLAAARLAHRDGRPAGPACPACGRPMALRTVRGGPRAGDQFWGCPAYPECRRTVPLDGPRETRR